MGRKKLLVLIISFNVALIAVLGGMIYQKHLEIEGLERARAQIYEQAFSQLAAHVAAIDTALQKCRYATSPELIVGLGTEIYGRAVRAGLHLEKLPPVGEALEQTALFLARTGDYARALARSAEGEGGHSEQAFSDLEALSGAAARLSETLSHIAERQAMGEGDIVTLLQEFQEEEERVEVFLPQNGGEKPKREWRFRGPPLTYDGAYSDHLLERRPERLDGMEEVTREEAKKSVSKVFDLKKEIFSYVGSRDGEIPVYRFLARVDGGDFLVEVSKIGGQVIRAQNDRQVRRAPLTREEGLRVARDFMERNGYAKMELQHWWLEENRVTGRFMHLQDGVVCYPDWMEVTVALDNGRVMTFDALGHVMHHRDRELEAPLLSMDEAREAIPPQLTVRKEGKAIIFTSGKHEVLVYTFRCQNEAGENYMVYVNARTGRQQDIRILVEDERGLFLY